MRTEEQEKPAILYEDNAIIVCHKPAGLATQTKRLGQQDMESLLKNYRAQKGEQPYIGIVHRLDQPVEGVMVFAKTKEAAGSLSKQVQNRSIGKHYYAIAQTGKHCGEKGELADYILADRKNNCSRVVKEGTPFAQLARLSYQVIRVIEDKNGQKPVALFDILLHTGRHHQIRVQFANMGCPLVGDAKYGGAEAKLQLALCSYRIAFAHPLTSQRMDFTVTPKSKVFELFQL